MTVKEINLCTNITRSTNVKNLNTTSMEVEILMTSLMTVKLKGTAENAHQISESLPLHIGTNLQNLKKMKMQSTEAEHTLILVAADITMTVLLRISIAFTQRLEGNGRSNLLTNKQHLQLGETKTNPV